MVRLPVAPGSDRELRKMPGSDAGAGGFLFLNGGLEKTRTSELFRVNLAKAILLLLFSPE
jgi:hypothetical protein